MIEAVLHGKLSCKQENMEDVLTSNVFGILQYVLPTVGIIPFLSRATTIGKVSPLASLLQARGEDIFASYCFWPKWPNCEPDVVLCVRVNSSLTYLIVIESKFRSGKSTEADEVEERPNDQLAREWLDLVHEADHIFAQPVLVYLTADVCCPRTQIQDSLDEYGRKRPADARQPVICWLSWRELPSLFRDEPNGQPLKAIARMMEDKLGLTFFHGVDVLPFRIGWTFHAPRWMFQVVPIMCGWNFARAIDT